MGTGANKRNSSQLAQVFSFGLTLVKFLTEPDLGHFGVGVGVSRKGKQSDISSSCHQLNIFLANHL
jgi:hypothetical protein